MIRVIRLKRADRDGFYAKGHAGYGAYGQDIVCAAVSALTQTALSGLIHYKIPVKSSVSKQDGILCVLAFPKTPQQAQYCEVIFTVLWEGLSRIRAQYPDCLFLGPTVE